MKLFSWILAVIIAVTITTSAQAKTAAELAADPSGIADAVASSTVEQAASLLTSVLAAIDELDLTSAEKESRMNDAIKGVYAAFAGNETALTQALGAALSTTAPALVAQAKSILASAGYDVSNFTPATGGGDTGGSGNDNVPPPIALQNTSAAVPTRPPTAPGYLGQTLE